MNKTFKCLDCHNTEVRKKSITDDTEEICNKDGCKGTMIVDFWSSGKPAPVKYKGANWVCNGGTY